MTRSKKSKTDIAIVLIPAALAAIAGVIAAFFSYSAGVDAVRIPLYATQTAEAKLTSTAPTPTPDVSKPPPAPVNLARRFDFENGLPPSASLGVCDNTLSPWYDHCYDGPERLSVVSGGFTGEKSLECQMEVLPDKEQVYTLRIPIDPPAFVDAISANVYTANADQLIKISLAAHPKGESPWVFSDLVPRKDGWLRLLVDLQSFKDDTGGPSGEIALDEIHIDIFVKQGQQTSQELTILIDDIELLYPLAKPFKTGP